MNVRTLLLPALIALLTIGCNSEDQLRRVEQEVGDLKLEVFKLRQQVEDSNKRCRGGAEGRPGGPDPGSPLPGGLCRRACARCRTLPGC